MMDEFRARIENGKQVIIIVNGLATDMNQYKLGMFGFEGGNFEDAEACFSGCEEEKICII